VFVINRYAVGKVLGAAAASAIIACGGGGAATDATQASPSPPEETTNPPANSPGNPPSGIVVTTPGETFSPRVVNVAPGGTVTWQFSGARHNVTFGTVQPAGGSIPDTDPGNSASRIFANAGTYDYQCTRHSGMTGQVIVGGAGTNPSAPQPTSGTLVLLTSGGFSPERAEISPGGTITWEFSDRADGIVFEDDAPPGGNIPETPRGGRESRTFPTAGDYDYYSLKDDDVKGRIRVR
jgi:plastocyanin